MSSVNFWWRYSTLDQTRRRQDFRDEYRMGVCHFVGAPGAVCHHQPTCGRSVLLNTTATFTPAITMFIRNIDGEYASADNCRNGRFPATAGVGEDKFKQLPAQCRSCNVLKRAGEAVRNTALCSMPAANPGELFVCRVSALFPPSTAIS